jgi:hypothetical protein
MHEGILNEPVVFSPDSSRVAYGAAEQNRQFVVLDEIPSRKYYGLIGGTTSFSPNSKHVAYVAMTSPTAFVLVVDDQFVPIRDIPVFGANLVWDNSDSVHTLATRIADRRVVICRWSGDG